MIFVKTVYEFSGVGKGGGGRGDTGPSNIYRGGPGPPWSDNIIYHIILIYQYISMILREYIRSCKVN